MVHPYLSIDRCFRASSTLACRPTSDDVQRSSVYVFDIKASPKLVRALRGTWERKPVDGTTGVKVLTSVGSIPASPTKQVGKLQDRNQNKWYYGTKALNLTHATYQESPLERWQHYSTWSTPRLRLLPTWSKNIRTPQSRNGYQEENGDGIQQGNR